MTVATSNPLFVPVGPYSRKVECRVCGRQGYDVNGYGWQLNCLRGHAPCPHCGTQRPLKMDGKPRQCGGRSQCAKARAS